MATRGRRRGSSSPSTSSASATLLGLVVPQSSSLGAEGVFGAGLGLTAYALGLRHAFDADHIAAIDNTTRKLMSDGQRPLSVGFFFSLGHSTIVFVLALLFSLGIKAPAGPVADDASTFHEVTGLIGTSVSGLFLYVIGVICCAFSSASRGCSGACDAAAATSTSSTSGSAPAGR